MESTAPPVEVAEGFTPEEIQKALTETGAEARLAAELEANRRARGHIPELQKRVSAAEKMLGRIDTIELTVKNAAERLDKIVSSLPDGLLDGQTLAALRPQDNETVTQLNARIQELADQLEAVRNPQKADEPELIPEQAQALAEWNGATSTVQKYAQSKGITFADDDPQWGRAYRANPDDPSVAAIELMRHIDGLSEQKARREERADAASGGDGSRTPRQGSVSLDQLKKMTRDEVKALDPKVVEAALAAG